MLWNLFLFKDYVVYVRYINDDLEKEFEVIVDILYEGEDNLYMGEWRQGEEVRILGIVEYIQG